MSTFIEVMTKDPRQSWGFHVEHVPAVGDKILLAYLPPNGIELEAAYATVTERKWSYSTAPDDWCDETDCDVEVTFEEPLPTGSRPHSEEWPVRVPEPAE